MAGDMVTSRVGRRRIVCDPMPLTRDNVGDVVRVASLQHAQNAGDIDALHRYFLGYQPIINRAKEVRPEIDSRVVENRADEIVSFKVGYQLGDPIKYVSRPTGDTHELLLDDADSQAHSVSALNALMADCGKHAVDRDLCQWGMVCGTAYRLMLPTGRSDEPLMLRSLDPRRTFVVYANDVAGEPMLGAVVSYDALGNQREWTAYSSDTCWRVDAQTFEVIDERPHACGGVPIVV